MKLKIIIALLSGALWGIMASLALEGGSPYLFLVGMPLGLFAGLLIDLLQPRRVASVCVVAAITLVLCAGLFCSIGVLLGFIPHFGEAPLHGLRPTSSMVYASQQSGRMVWHMVSTPWIFLVWPLAIFNHLIYMRFSCPLPPVAARSS